MNLKFLNIILVFLVEYASILEIKSINLIKKQKINY